MTRRSTPSSGRPLLTSRSTASCTRKSPAERRPPCLREPRGPQERIQQTTVEQIIDTFVRRCWHAEKNGVNIQNVPVCKKCGCGAGTHGDVLHVHTGRRWREGHRQFCLSKFLHVGLSHAPEVQQRNPWILPIQKIESWSRTTPARIL